jgi:Uncharacterized protein conserved in bacteria (DUF2333)
MEEQKTIENGQDASSEDKTFKGYAAKRMIVGVLLTVVGLWIFGTVIGFFDTSPTRRVAEAPAQTTEQAHGPAAKSAGARHTTASGAHATPAAAYQHLERKNAAAQPHGAVQGTSAGAHGTAQGTSAGTHGTAQGTSAGAHGTAQGTSAGAHGTAQGTSAGAHGAAQGTSAGTHGAAQGMAAGTQAASAGHGTAATGHGAPFGGVPQANGVAFVAATIAPMAHELDERFYGWRPNDILDFTDNVNNIQLGILEVTRRTAVNLAERISRTGSTDAFDPNLENAMNWFMIKATRYWFPSPESKYSAGLDELATYMENLKKGQATFHNRTDNLIPLLTAFEDLLGSCDENLAKYQEEDGRDVSFFKADNYFFYAKGVASAMHTILEAVAQDFQEVINSRRGAELLHHAVVSLHHATEIEPWLITNADLSGVLANHRANMAAPISHARFYIGALIKTLST